MIKENHRHFDFDFSQLTAIQREVTQNGSTERPFENEFWDHKDEGIYVDVVSGEPLFTSVHKFDSGSGWPSFFQTIVPKNEKKCLTSVMA